MVRRDDHDIRVDVLVHDLGRRLAAVRDPARDHVIQRGAQAVDVGPNVDVRLAADLLDQPGRQDGIAEVHDSRLRWNGHGLSLADGRYDSAVHHECGILDALKRSQQLPG